MDTVTPASALLVLKNLSGLAGVNAAASNVDLLALRDLSGLADITSLTPGAALYFLVRRGYRLRVVRDSVGLNLQMD
jgi:hypothetical protein